jgi:uncharacterized protein YmfQ (DUF2313 family)
MSARESHQHTQTLLFEEQTWPVVAVPGDGLSSPTNDGLISAALSFWPVGAAWGTPDGQALSLGSVLARFTRALVAPFEWLYARAWRLALESSVQTAGETLDEWELEYGLPERCFPGEQSTSQRMSSLRRKVSAVPLAHPEDFIRVAAEFGFPIEIEEPCIFECGYSNCGGEHETGAAREEAFIVVRVLSASESYFECGTSECGFDRLYDLIGTEQIVCFLREHLPGWVIAHPTTAAGLGFILTSAEDDFQNYILVFTHEDNADYILTGDLN